MGQTKESGVGMQTFKPTEKSLIFDVWELLRGRRALSLLQVFTSLLEGMFEALILLLLAMLGLNSLSAQGSLELDRLGLSVGLTGQAILLVGFVLLRLFAALLSARLRTRTEVEVSRKLRITMLMSYLDADAEARWALPRGSDQQALAIWPQQTGALVGSILATASNLVIMVAMLGIAFASEAAGSAMILGAVVIGSCAFWPLRIRIRRLSRGVVESQGRLAESIHELGDLVSEVEIFGVKNEFKSRVSKWIDDEAVWRDMTTFSKAVVSPLYTALLFFAVSMGLLLLSTSGTGQINRYGSVLLIVIRSISYGQSVLQLGTMFASLNPLMDRLVSVERALSSKRMSWGVGRLKKFETLELSDVSYSYPNSDFGVRNLNFRLTKGMRVGVVGPSGGGKSTLARLLLGEAAPNSGAVLINGSSLKDVEESEYRRIISGVPQFPHLLNGNLEQNVKFMRKTVSREAVAEALVGADLALTDVVPGTCAGEETGGSSMSGGQIQRVGLARALAGFPEVLVLDEPTSAVDHLAQARITESLQALPDSITMVIITHRREILELCSTIVIIEGGRISDVGSAEEILSGSRYFREESNGPNIM